VANDRSLVDLDPISPEQVLGLLRPENALRTRLVLGRRAGTLSVDLPQDPAGTEASPEPPVEVRAGDEGPLFTGRDLQGQDVSLKDLRGRLVLIDFWASTCAPCARAVIPLRRIAEQHTGTVQIVGVSLDADRKAFEAFVYNHHLPGIQLFDGEGWQGRIARLYGVQASGIPYYVLLDAKGRIAAIGELDQAEEAIGRLSGQ
jgi:peroxiredoxin